MTGRLMSVDGTVFQVFNENTHIVAVKTSGNVYCMQALEELCIKPKNYRDLISDEPFNRKDIITIQDSQKVDGLNYDRLLKVCTHSYLQRDASMTSTSFDCHLFVLSPPAATCRFVRISSWLVKSKRPA